MKICYIGNPKSLFIRDLVEYFSAIGYEVHTFSWGPYPYKKNDRIKHHNISIINKYRNKNNTLNIDSYSYLNKKFNKNKIKKIVDIYEYLIIKLLIKVINPNIIHGHEVLGNGFITGSCKRHPTIITCWGSDINKYPHESRINNFKVNYALNNCDIIHVTDETFAKTISNKFDIDNEKIRIIDYGIDNDLFSHDYIDENNLKLFKKKNGIEKEDFIILYPAGFRDYKFQNYINIVDAFILLSREYSNIKLFMLTYNRSSGYNIIINKIINNNMKNKIILLDDFIKHEDMPYLFSITKIMVILHDFDQMAATILESLSMDCVLLLSRIKTYTNIFHDGKNVIFTNQKDVNDIINKFKYIIDNYSILHENFKNNNKDYISNNQKAEKMKSIDNMYKYLINSYNR